MPSKETDKKMPLRGGAAITIKGWESTTKYQRKWLVSKLDSPIRLIS